MVIIIIIVIVIFALFLLLLFKKCDNFAEETKMPRRPHHPKFYKDLPEDHPEVLGLYEEMKKQMNETPKFTENGFLKLRIPEGIYSKLLGVVRNTDRVPETSKAIFARSSRGLPPYLIPISKELRKEVEEELRPMLQEWSKVDNLVATSTYGPREYRRGSSLRMHCDLGDTHIISAILQIDREGMERDWPLIIINRENQKQNIYLEPGEMLFYESASLPHSRDLPLEGNYYTNMFVHFAPKNYSQLKNNLKKK